MLKYSDKADDRSCNHNVLLIRPITFAIKNTFNDTTQWKSEIAMIFVQYSFV